MTTSEADRRRTDDGDPLSSIVDRIIAEAPPLTEDQRRKISALLRTGDTT